MTSKLSFTALLFLLLCTQSFSKGVQINKENKAFSFAFLSDIHIANDAKSVEDITACVNDINSLADIKFVIFAGDITEFGSDQEIELAKKIFDGLNKPYYVVAGNHDSKWSESGCNTFAKKFAYEKFNFSYNGITFIGTNSGPNMRMAPALVPRESMVWLDSLSRAIDSNEPVFYVNHYPLDTSVLNYKQVLTVLKMNTQLVLNGHWHQNRSMVYEGIPAVIGRSSMAVGKEGPGYNIVSVNNSCVTFSERIVYKESDGQKNGGPKTKTPWHTLRMSRGRAFVEPSIVDSSAFNVNLQYKNVKTIWRHNDNSDIGSAAVMGANYVVYANTKGEIFALNANNGEQIWKFTTGGKVFSSPIIAQDGNVLQPYSKLKSAQVVVGSSDGNIYALNLIDGKLLWTYKCNKAVLASPQIYNGRVFIGASDGVFRALDLKSGKLLWGQDILKGFVESKAFVDDKQVVVGDWANGLYSFDPKSGSLQWKLENSGSRMLSAAAVWPVKANGKIFFVTPQRYSFAIEAQTGKQIFKEYGGRESIGLSPDKSMYFVKTMKDTLIAFSTKDTFVDGANVRPKRLWAVNCNFGYEIAPSPITSIAGLGKELKGLLFVPTDKGNIYALNVSDGSISWQYKISYALINYIQPVKKGKLLISTMDGAVVLIEY